MELELEPSNSIELHMGPVGQYEIIKTQLTTAGETEVDKDTVTVYTNVADAAHALWHTQFSEQVESRWFHQWWALLRSH